MFIMFLMCKNFINFISKHIEFDWVNYNILPSYVCLKAIRVTILFICIVNNSNINCIMFIQLFYWRESGVRSCLENIQK